MATTIVTKKGSGAPAASDLVEGELAVDTTNGRLYTENSSAAVVELGSNPSGNITFGDNGKAIFGAGSDLQIYHNGSKSIIHDVTAGNLEILADDFAIKNSTGVNTLFFADAPSGAVSLYHSNAAKLATTSTGIDVTGDIVLGDSNPQITFNDSSTVNLQHLIVSSSDKLLLSADHNNVDAGTKIEFAVDGTERMEVNSTGIDVTGSVTADGLTVDGDGLAYSASNIEMRGDANVRVTLGTAGTSGANNNSNWVYGNGNNLRFNNAGGFYSWETVGTERLRIDSSGNVGIGTDSPSGVLHLRDTTPHLYIQSDDAQSSKLLFGDASDNSRGGFEYTSSDAMIFMTNNLSEKMRIDASGSLLVGTTDTAPATNNVAGVALRNEGHINVSRDGGTVAYFNRSTSDGTILDFRKDGTTVGNINTASGYLQVQSAGGNFRWGANNTNQLSVDASQMYPMTDNALTLGAAGVRFKDLYLSGGAYLGGTAAANKLDDYESGTWTPTFNSASFTTTGVTSVSGNYVKIGDFVQVSFIISFTGTSGNFAEGDTASIGGLPFNPVTYNGGGTANASQDYLGNVRMAWQTLPTAGSANIFMVIHSGAGTVGRATGIHGMATYLV